MSSRKHYSGSAPNRKVKSGLSMTHPAARNVSNFELRKDFITAAGTLNGARNPERALRALEKVEKRISSFDQISAGRMAVEIAVKSKVSDECKLDLLGRAKESWEKVISRDISAGLVTPDGIASKIGLATLPSYAIIAIDGTIPKKSISEKMHAEMLEIGHDASTAWRYFSNISHTKNDLANIKAVAGLQAEIAVMSLINRFTLTKIGDGSEIALPSHFSHDHSDYREHGALHSNTWDLNVFTNYGDFDNPADWLHAIQVKSTLPREYFKSTQKRDSRQGIARVVVSSDLQVTYREIQKNSVGSDVINQNLWYETHDQDSRELNAEILDKRTDLLMDIIEENSDVSLLKY